MEIATLSRKTDPRQTSIDFTPRLRNGKPIVWTIYCHTCKVNGKRYIGQTKNGMQHRWRAHVVAATSGRGGSELFGRAIRKHGAESFNHDVLQTVGTLEEANAAEIKWIAHYRATESDFGYNLNAGGYVCNTHPDTRAKISRSARARMALIPRSERMRAARDGRAAMTQEQKSEASRLMWLARTRNGTRNIQIRDWPTLEALRAWMRGWHEEHGRPISMAEYNAYAPLHD